MVNSDLRLTTAPEETIKPLERVLPDPDPDCVVRPATSIEPSASTALLTACRSRVLAAWVML